MLHIWRFLHKFQVARINFFSEVKFISSIKMGLRRSDNLTIAPQNRMRFQDRSSVWTSAYCNCGFPLGYFPVWEHMARSVFVGGVLSCELSCWRAGPSLRSNMFVVKPKSRSTRRGFSFSSWTVAQSSLFSKKNRRALESSPLIHY